MKTSDIVAFISEKMNESDDVEISIKRGYSEYEGLDGFINRELDGSMTIGGA